MGNSVAAALSVKSEIPIASAEISLSARVPVIPASDADRFDPAVYRADELERILDDFSTLPMRLLDAAKAGYEFRMDDMSREEGILTPMTMRRALFAYSRLFVDDQKYVLGLFNTFSSGDASEVVGHALLIKALAFNAFDRGAILAFCNNLHAYDAREMLNMTTLAEIDPETDTDPFDRWGFWEAAGSGDPGDDGAKQVFSTSCLPSSVLMYKGETNPVYALFVHESGYDAPQAGLPWFTEQERLLRVSSYWSKRFNDPIWRINEVLIEQAGIVPLFRELYDNGTFDATLYGVLLERLISFAEGRENGEALVKCAGEELERFRAETTVASPGAQEWVWQAIASRLIVPPEAKYASMDTVDILGPYEKAFRELLARQGYPTDNGWGFGQLFDYEQFGMAGTQVFDQFTPQNSGDEFSRPGIETFPKDSALAIGLLAAGQDVIMSWPNHASLATDIRLRYGALELYNADPYTGTGEWLKLSDIPDGTEFYYPTR